MKIDHEVEDLARRGLNSTVAAYQMAIDILVRERDAVLRRLGELQEAPRAKRGRGRPAKSEYGWSADPLERKRDMARRMAVRDQKRALKLHPRDPRHPEHAKWLAKMRKAGRKNWEGLSRTERQNKLAAMRRGRKDQAAAEMRAVA